jgi:hypothetical protein
VLPRYVKLIIEHLLTNIKMPLSKAVCNTTEFRNLNDIDQIHFVNEALNKMWKIAGMNSLLFNF